MLFLVLFSVTVSFSYVLLPSAVPFMPRSLQHNAFIRTAQEGAAACMCTYMHKRWRPVLLSYFKLGGVC